MKTDRIEKRIDLKAPVSRVWRALTDHVEFGKWFGSKMESPFVPGKTTKGRILHKGFERIQLELTVLKLKPKEFFSYTWHPYAIDPDEDYSKEKPTLVEFRLEEIPTGTHLVVTESGFGKVPAGRRSEAFRMHADGWGEQLKNIKRYVAKKK
jgi:uncharacterized protein YndB with AHSA1/START domain